MRRNFGGCCAKQNRMQTRNPVIESHVPLVTALDSPSNTALRQSQVRRQSLAVAQILYPP